ncbi:serine hydrolase domain-containing protein [Streptomyces malaysiense]|uniref:D-alanyl-D-alanine carboxypeptidase n=1 Tax=Streptomyces malaysiense TaxID=1428626 RepID=A0A1J4PW83_9ACTN|nr:serine hydrolase domain-containing protein [Streptomyces malaysiense]OIK24374.1 D-alanyl-D-alanine carboxypeptidase [Streptomyces malaysiense]
MNAFKRRLTLLALAAALVATTATAAPALAAGAPAVQAAAATQSASPIGASGLNRTALDAAVGLHPGDRAGGQLARVSTPDQIWRGSSSDAFTSRPISPDAHFHIGSISKAFEATVALQLAAEGKLDLDQTVQYYLPGLLPDSYQPITVRQLLNHTSGLPDMQAGIPNPTADQLIGEHLDYFTLDDVIHSSLHPADGSTPPLHFTPGSKQEYSSLGYRIAAKIIEQVTGNSFGDEVTSRVIRPLHLNHTSVPEGDTRMPRPALHGYVIDSTGRPVDVSEQGDDATAVISTAPDLDHFISALFSGRLLDPEQLYEMFAVPLDSAGSPLHYADGSDCDTGTAKGTACYGAGLKSVTLPDGTVLWGKTGHDIGYASGVFATRDLKLRTVYAVGTSTADNGGSPAVANRLIAALLTPPTATTATH